MRHLKTPLVCLTPLVCHEDLLISQILRHSKGGVTAIYNRNKVDQQKKEAMDRWSRRLAMILSGAGTRQVVIPFKKG